MMEELKRLWKKATQRELIALVVAMLATLHQSSLCQDESGVCKMIGAGLAVAAALGYGALRTHRKNTKDKVKAGLMPKIDLLAGISALRDDPDA